MRQKRYAKLSFSMILVGALFAGGFALLSEPASATPPCPRTVCGSTSGWTLQGSCIYTERSTGCAFLCDKYTSGSQSCRTNCWIL